MSIGVLICEDLWEHGYDFSPCQLLRDKGTEYLFCINASPFVGSSPGEKDGKRFVRERIIREQIRRHGIPIIYINTVGVGDNGKNIIPFDGMSLAFDREGNPARVLSQFKEEQQFVDFDQGRSDAVPLPPFDLAAAGRFADAIAAAGSAGRGRTSRGRCERDGAIDRPRQTEIEKERRQKEPEQERG